MNNAEKIRSLTDKELAIFLCSISPGDCWNCKAEKYCKKMDGTGMQEWIKQEAKEEDYWREGEDAVPVVRCKDCKYAQNIYWYDTLEPDGLWCSRLDVEEVLENEFCCWGERKESK